MSYFIVAAYRQEQRGEGIPTSDKDQPRHAAAVQDAACGCRIRMLLQSVKGSHFTLNHIGCCKHVSYHEIFQVLQTTGSGPALRMAVCDVYVPAGWLQSVFKLSQGMESQSKQITHKV